MRGGSISGLALGAFWLLVAMPARASTLTTLYSIAGSGDGTTPAGTLVNSSGVLYGTTLAGGAHNVGTIFSFDPTQPGEKVLYDFTDETDGGGYSGSLSEVGGILYGTTAGGGTYQQGTVFKFDPATATKTILYAFMAGQDGATPNPSAPLLYLNGTLYGVTEGGGANSFGTVFKIDPATGAEKVLYAFPGNGEAGVPIGGLVDINGTLYGTTLYGGPANQGTVFSIDRKTGAEATIYSLPGGTGGAAPGGLAAIGGILYITADYGGTAGYGAILSLDPATGKAAQVYAFKGGSDAANPVAAPLEIAGTLYGTAMAGGPADLGGTYAINLKTGTEKLLYGLMGKADGGSPAGGLASVNGMLYGLAAGQGIYGGGTLFQLDRKTGADTTAHAFTGPPSQNVAESLLNAKGKIVLSSAQGGPVNRGAVVKIDPASGVAKTLDAFANAGDGAQPFAPVLLIGGTYYGTTKYGGTTGNGTVYKINALTGTETVLHDFNGNGDGRIPAGALSYLGGALYGTTVVGGAMEFGTVFKIDPTTGAETVLHSFTGDTDGSDPYGNLILLKGVFYGTTSAGGASNEGTVFSFNPATATETPLYAFGTAGRDGGVPETGLLNVGGLFYGTTLYGGQFSQGTVFTFNPATRTETVLHSFNGLFDGGTPAAALIASGGMLYGTAQDYGPSGYGLVFAMDPVSGVETVLYTFGNGSDGGNPGAALISIGNLLYGATSSGGAANLGTVFSLQP